LRALSSIGARSLIQVAAFIDWNSQLRSVGYPDEINPADRAREALRRLGASVSRILAAEDQMARFRLNLRLYCGWTKGFTRSDYFKAIAGLVEAFDVDPLFPSSRVNVSPDFGFGDRLIDGLPERLNSGLGIHLPNTLRDQGTGHFKEKMVDTAFACDLLSWVRTNPNGWALVVSNDDDLVPPVFVAEAWMQHSPGRVLLLRNQERSSDKFLRLEGLLRS
jgi:hypothetical protein